MRISQFIISILIFTVIVTGAVSFFYDFSSFYNIKTSDEGGSYTSLYQKLNDSMPKYNQVDDTLIIEEQMATKMSNFTSTETQAEDTQIASIGSAVSLGWQSFGIAKELIYGVANDIGIPNFIVSTVMAIMLITLIAAVIFALFKREA